MGFPLLTRRGARYYFRVRIPADLCEFFSRRELKRSLQTADHRKARNMVKIETARAAITFEKMRDKALTREQLKQIAEDYLQTLLENWEQAREEGSGSPQGITTPEHLRRNQLSFVEVYQKDLAVNDFSLIKEDLKIILEEMQRQGLGIEDDQQLTMLSRELLKKRIEASRIESERVVGNYSSKHEVFTRNRQEIVTPKQPEREQGKPLSVVIGAYVQEHLTFKKWTPKTEQENTSILAVFLELVEDRDITTITHQELMTFRANLVKVPANPKKGRDKEGKPLKEIIEMGLPPISQRTVGKYLTRVASFFKWAKLHKYVETNEAEGLTIKESKKAKASGDRNTYGVDDLEKIFKALTYDHKKPESFWIPLIGLYSGMRIDEICQLHLEDVKSIEGIPCFDVNEEGSKKVKTVSSSRIVPVHPVLITLGFLDYVEQIRVQGKPRLWENCILKRDGYSQDFGKWYQRFNRKYITQERKKVFHSFRHLVADTLKQSGIQETVTAELLGQKNENITYSRYGKSYKPQPLLEALQKLEYGVDLEILKGKVPAKL
ncbi:MAG: site-specific integrase [Deltaproteobacteria bacterium]|nr:site-specific integrase [Deltaproteobacteria bacterium]TLN04263.1 MAG: site-specific integrase [bacterium]